jgi:hypothetical protein
MYILAESSYSAGAGIVALLFFLGAIAFYFLPWIQAAIRKHHNIGPVVIVNIFLGWTFIGWVIALAMAFSNPSPQTQQTVVVQREAK